MKERNILAICALVILVAITGCSQTRVTQESIKMPKGKEKIEPPSDILSYYVHKVERGEDFYELFGQNWKTVARINRVSPSGLVPGMEFLVPLDFEKARKEYCPLPGSIEKPVDVVIDLGAQALGKYKNGELQRWYPISSGKKGHRTPTGRFHISRKVKFYRSKTYPKPDGGAPMPYALNFYNGYWIHGGKLPGRPASHGCVRLIREDAHELYHNTPKWDEVWVKEN